MLCERCAISVISILRRPPRYLNGYFEDLSSSCGFENILVAFMVKSDFNLRGLFRGNNLILKLRLRPFGFFFFLSLVKVRYLFIIESFLLCPVCQFLDVSIFIFFPGFIVFLEIRCGVCTFGGGVIIFSGLLGSLRF